MKIKQMIGCAALGLCGLVLSSTAPAQINEHTFRIAINGAPGHPVVVGSEKWAELINKKSGGKMTLKVFPSTLGGDVQVLSAVQGGTIDFASMNSGILQGIQKEYAIFDFPFMFESGKEADTVLDGPFGKKLADLLPSKGLYNVIFWELGFRQLTNSKRPVAKADDIVGPEVARDPVADLRRHLQRTRRQCGPDEFFGTVYRAGTEDHRRAGKPLLR